jgi:hypothetical protein
MVVTRRPALQLSVPIDGNHPEEIMSSYRSLARHNDVGGVCSFYVMANAHSDSVPVYDFRALYMVTEGVSPDFFRMFFGMHSTTHPLAVD